VNGLRGEGASIPGRLDHDLQYLRAWTLALDARILWRTAATVWRDTRRDLGR
jgi:lipopolysaccharide/colanic/teichoic acid biosynthesis glycosyltransferase